MQNTIVLSIETSCDDSCVAIIKVSENNQVEILANLIYNQNHLHGKYGGVVPEIAARSHLHKLSMITAEALHLSNLKIEDINLICYTSHPGLLGSLLVGINFSKGLALRHHIPCVAVNHIEAHLMVNFMNKIPPFEFPILGLVISGGHTELWRFRSLTDYEILEKTADDAIGELFDKVGRLMDLPFPGGRHLEELAKESTTLLPVSLPKILSFSGLKTKFSRLLEEGANKADVANTLEQVSGQLLVETIKKHIQPNEKLIVGGGVCANNTIRMLLSRYFTVEFIPKILCTDNGVMIGYRGYLHTLKKD